MPRKVLTRRRSIVAKLTVLALVASFLVIAAVPAGAAIDTTASCPANTPSAGFTDIGSFDATTVRAINCLVLYGITQGTSATTYSPNGSVSRWQMALFLTRQAVDHGLTLGSGVSQGFTDIGGFDAATQTAINQLAQLDITQGTSATTFDPNLVVSRWQMALFLTRLADAAGVTLPTGASQGFTDIATLSAEAQLAINQAKQLGIADGFTATTFSPTTDTLRWQMALFLTRTLAADGIVPSGLGFIVTIDGPGADQFSYANPGTDEEVDVTVASGSTFTVDGLAASQGAFFSQLTVGDVVNIVGSAPTQYQLTNRTNATFYVNGTIDGVDLVANTYDIAEPVTGTVLNTVDYSGAFTLYTTDGVAASLAGFEDDLQAGDTVASSGTGASASAIRTIAVTNATISGAATEGAANAFQVGDFSDLFQVVAADSLTVGGVAATEAEFETALSSGDTITLSRDNARITAALVNAASAAIAGKVLNNDGAATDDVDIDGAAADQVYDNAGTVYIVNGLLADIAGLEAALTAGDDISIVRADAVVNMVDRITLTNGAFSGEVSAIVVVANTVAVTFTDGGGVSEAVVYNVNNPDVGLTGTSVVYTVNGASASEAQFEAAVTNAVVNGGTVGVTLVGNVITWAFAA